MPGPYQSRFLWQDGEVFLDEAIGMGMKHFHFSGKESFLDNRIFDILNLLAEYKEDRKIFYGVVSNGMSMDIQGYDEVLATNISYLEISLEGSGKYNDLIRGENGYNTVYELIENVEHRDKINITSTIFDDNGADLLSMLLAYWKLGVDKFNFAPIMYYSPFEMKPLKSLSCESLLGFVSLCLDFMNNDNSPDAIDIRICMTKAMAYELFLKENILTGKIEEYIYRGNKMKYQRGIRCWSLVILYSAFHSLMNWSLLMMVTLYPVQMIFIISILIRSLYRT